MVDSGEAKVADAGETQKVNGEVDRLAQLEAVVGKLADAVGKQAEQVEAVMQAAGKLQKQDQLRMARSPEKLLDSSGDIEVLRGQIDGTPKRRRGPKTPFVREDLVRYREDSVKAQVIRSRAAKAGLQLGPDDPMPLGIVIDPLYQRRKDDKWKFKVYFKGLGQDGCLEDEIELVSRSGS